MFDNIEQFLKGEATLNVDKTGQATPRDLQIATAVLLVQMAEIDQNLSDEELASLVSSLNKQFTLSDAEAGHVLEVAQYLCNDGDKIASIISAVNDGFEESQKKTVLAMLWRVMQADGLISRFEATFAAQIASALGMDDAQVAEAKEMADSGTV